MKNIFLALLCSGLSLSAADMHAFHSRAHTVTPRLTPLGRLDADRQLKLIIGLPLHHADDLGLLMNQLYDTHSPNFRQYLTPAQFAARFGPTADEYDQVKAFARSNHFQITQEYTNCRMLDVTARVADIEGAFHVTMHTYQHPAEARQFFAPDAEATVDASLPIVDVSGLDDFIKPHPLLHPSRPDAAPASGSAPGGTFRGNDFRKAYAPDVSATGSGQNVGLVEFEGYYKSDIVAYAAQAGLTATTLTNRFLDGLNATNFINTSDTNGIAECSLDIEMPMSMANGLNKIYVYEGSSTDHILQAMADDTQVLQFSASWEMGDDSTAEQYLRQLIVQGQSFFVASGDGDAYIVTSIYWPTATTNVTSVGGTQLSTSSTGAYASETVWNSGFDSNGAWCCNDQTKTNAYWGSGGGFDTSTPIPPWQTGANPSSAGGSSTYRNVPDVALTAQSVSVDYDNGLSGGFMGTSCAAPLWAGFTALINQNASDNGAPPIGFLNPAIYSIGESPLYATTLHDITNGNSTWPGSPSKYYALPGYDLCTGWGTPVGQATINALFSYGGQVWVNFAATTCPGQGTIASPYCTLASATNAVATSGTICLIGTHSSSVTPTINKPMTLRAFYGPVTIGQ